MWETYYAIFSYFIDTQAGVVRAERLLLHKGDTNNVLSTTIAYAVCIVIYQYNCVMCA